MLHRDLWTEGLLQWLQFLIIDHTFHKGKPQTREWSRWLLHTSLHIAHRSLPVQCQSNRPQTFVSSHHHPPILFTFLQLSTGSSAGFKQQHALHCHWQWPALLIYPIWNQRNMQRGGTPISVSCSECGLRCQVPGCVFTPSLFSLSHVFHRVFHDPITYSMLLVNLPGKLWVGWAVYCEVTLHDAVIVP